MGMHAYELCDWKRWQPKLHVMNFIELCDHVFMLPKNLYLMHFMIISNLPELSVYQYYNNVGVLYTDDCMSLSGGILSSDDRASMYRLQVSELGPL